MQTLKHGPVNWQFGDDEPVAEQPDNEPNPAPPHVPTSGSRRRAWLIVFLIALAASWTTGFYLGRVQRSTAGLETKIQGRLDVESWAWQQSDWDLYRSLFPPRTPSWHLKSLQMMFNAAAPQNLDMELAHYVVSEDGNQIEATVRISADGRQYETEHSYRLINGQWRLVRLEETDGYLVHP